MFATMSITTVLFHLLVVLLFAKLAAEGAERLGVPAVVGEILAGILIGPSALGLVHGDDVVRVLGEIGVILLLLEVGLEMDIAELASVGRAAILVASIGVVAPFALGDGVGLLFGMTGKEALFVGAALTATSVGITARVFGDLKVLATVEARTVLGAAVADDVIGLVILTVVVRLVTAGSVSVLDVGQVIAVALVFLVGATMIGLWLAPPAFHWVDRHARSTGTLVPLALVFTLALAELANVAKLAPIVGAFVAGVVLSRSQVSERVRRELTPVGHLFIPVFFLQIGIDADIGQFARPAVLALAAALLAVAVVGKLVSPLGMLGSRGDRVLVGLAMIPRGEVGLIFATIGLQQHVFGENIYASVLLVVLATTLLTPPLLRWRLQHQSKVASAPAVTTPRPEGGWLVVEGGRSRGLVELAGEPPVGDALAVALEAAQAVNEHAPGPRLLDWLATGDVDQPMRWDRDARAAFFSLLRHGGPRSWRFLSITGVLDRSLPELAAAVRERESESYGFDPLAGLSWATLETGRRQLEEGNFGLEHPEWVTLAATIFDAVGGEIREGIVVARRVSQRLDMGATAEEAVAGLLRDLELFVSTARRLDAFGEERVQQLAQHLGGPQQATRLLVLALATDGDDLVIEQRLRTLHERLTQALAHPELVSRRAANLVDARRSEATRSSPDAATSARLAAAPRSFVLSQAPADLARQATLCERLGSASGPLVQVSPDGDTWRVDVAAHDQAGLLAAQASALSRIGLAVIGADLGVWDDGRTITSFEVVGEPDIETDRLAVHLAQNLRGPVTLRPLPDAQITWDDQLSPWHSVLRVETPDQPGLLATLAAAISHAGLDIHSAHVATAGERAVDQFDVSGPTGGKVDAATQAAAVELIVTGTGRGGRSTGRRLGRRRRAGVPGA